MTLAHPIIGLILGKKFGHTTTFLAGSILPDINHFFVLIKNKYFKIRETFAVMKYEKRYGENYKTPYTHSLLAWLILSAFSFFINLNFGFAFSIGYLIHLILDLLDSDEKQLFFPFKKRVKGFLPVFNLGEMFLAAILMVIYFLI